MKIKTRSWLSICHFSATNNQKHYASILSFMLLASPIDISENLHLTSTKMTNLPGIQTRDRLIELRQKQIPIATSIRGTLNTPIIWTDSFQSASTRATINLDEPILYSNGDIALPRDSSLIVEVSDWDDAGFVNLIAIAIVYEDIRGELIQHNIPEGALLIRNEDNQPLAFKTEESKRGNSIVGEVVDEALQTGARSLPLPGGINSAISRSLRNNSRRSRRFNSGAVYSIQEETVVSIYVNSFIKIEN